MNMKTLKDIIEKQKKEEEEEQKFDPAEQIEEYISLVEKLYTITLESIDELIKDGLIKQSRKKISINEESLGDYEIDSLILT
ncbi:hypothetical protein K9H75_27270, partial [Klebsiella pneumoniae]|uniref:hypothetical protein n=1 Tax=Klebsiella pneumoniae TaxID=573 RepID=UPI0022CE278E